MVAAFARAFTAFVFSCLPSCSSFTLNNIESFLGCPHFPSCVTGRVLVPVTNPSGTGR